MKLTNLLITCIFILIFAGSLNALSIKDVDMNPNEIAPGETADVAITLENEADVDINEVLIILDFKDTPFAPYNSGSYYSIDEIQDDDEEDANFQIIALNDASSVIHKIPVKITYKEKQEIKTKESLISLMINSEPVVDVQLEDSVNIKGKEGKISVKVINKGLSDIKFLDIEIGSSGSYSILSQKKVYIGDINSNDFDSADFSLFFKETSSKTINIPVTITYKDIKNEQKTQSFSLQANVYTNDETIKLGLVKKSNAKLYAILIFAVIVVYFIYRKIKKRKRKFVNK